MCDNRGQGYQRHAAGSIRIDQIAWVTTGTRDSVEGKGQQEAALASEKNAYEMPDLALEQAGFYASLHSQHI